MKRISMMAIAAASMAALLGVAGCSQSDDDTPPDTGADSATSAQQQSDSAAANDAGNQSDMQGTDSTDDSDSDTHDDLSSQGMPPDESSRDLDHSPESDPQSGTLEGGQTDQTQQ
ncbi:hypothetical protein [Carnimonas nigrificans]|uniref:hypothetical protein n=1 Tax=Carnimonas nigrificans TaxID=64323 RepID=UPI000471CD83|nr:hypothetical protein [Carnimonas nigrificans]